MSPKTKFSKEDIVEAGFDIAKSNGLAGITARNVAKKLNSSVAPIYVNFETIDDLITAVVERVFAYSNELMTKQVGPNVFESIGKASLEFARECPVLFRELSLQPNPYMASYDTVESSMLEALAKDREMQGWTLDERRKLFFKMRVFHIGLAAMVANGHMPSWLDEQGVEEMLFEVGEELLNIQKNKQGERKK